MSLQSMRCIKWLGLVPAAVFLLFSGCNGPGTVSPQSPPTDPQFIPNMNQWITPLAPLGSSFQPLSTPWLVNGKPWLAGQGVSSVVSTDGKTVFVLTSGFNRIFNGDSLLDMAFEAGPPVVLAPGESIPDQALPKAKSPSSEYVFIYDISRGAPVHEQSVMVPNTYHGIAYDPTQEAFYVSSGVGDFPFDKAGNLDPSDFQSDSVHIFTLS